MTPEQAERLLTLAREAVHVAERHKGRLTLAPSDVKSNLRQLKELVEEIDRSR